MEPGALASTRQLSATPLEPATLARWEHAMRSARAARELGQLRLAAACQHQALALSLRLLEQAPPPGREDDCVAALVVSHLNLADLQAQAAALDDAAQLLCRAHALLLGLMADARHGTPLRQAAWRHSRETHAALLQHLRAHGPHPAISKTLAAAQEAHTAGLPH